MYEAIHSLFVTSMQRDLKNVNTFSPFRQIHVCLTCPVCRKHSFFISQVAAQESSAETVFR